MNKQTDNNYYVDFEQFNISSKDRLALASTAMFRSCAFTTNFSPIPVRLFSGDIVKKRGDSAFYRVCQIVDDWALCAIVDFDNVAKKWRVDSRTPCQVLHMGELEKIELPKTNDNVMERGAASLVNKTVNSQTTNEVRYDKSIGTRIKPNEKSEQSPTSKATAQWLETYRQDVVAYKEKHKGVQYDSEKA